MAAPMRSTFYIRKLGCYMFASPLRDEIKRKFWQQHFTSFKRSWYSTTRNKKIWEFGPKLSCAVALAGCTGYIAHSCLKSTNTVIASGGNPIIENIKRSRQVRVDTDNSGLKLTLFQFQTCPFCCKVRAVLDYYGFSYDVVEVNSVTKKQLRWSDYRKVPVLVCETGNSDEFLQMYESSVIVSLLETFLIDKKQSLQQLLTFYPGIEVTEGKRRKKMDFPNRYFIMYQDSKAPGSMAQRKEEREWREWVDDVFVHVLSPNVYRTPSEALESFYYFSDVGEWERNFSTPERYLVIYIGAAAMYFLGKVLKKRHQLKDDVRQSLYDTCTEWMKGIGPSRQFMGGNQPNLADLSMYGVLCSIEGCGTFQDLLKNTTVGPWFYRTKSAVQSHAGAHPLRES